MHSCKIMHYIRVKAICTYINFYHFLSCTGNTNLPAGAAPACNSTVIIGILASISGFLLLILATVILGICICLYVHASRRKRKEAGEIKPYILVGSYIQSILGIYIYICYVYSTVGRSIADIYDPRQHIYLGASRLNKYAAEVVYIGYGPTYRIKYTIYYGECATDEPFA